MAPRPRARDFADIAPLLDAIGEHGMARDARDIASGRLRHPDVSQVICPRCHQLIWAGDPGHWEVCRG